MPGKRRQQAAETGAALKEAALRVFARVGYLNAKITDITAEAGRAAGSFYSHFPNKEALLEALVADMLADMDASVLAGDGHLDDFTTREAVRWHVAAFRRMQQRHRTLMGALQQAAIVDTAFAERLRRLTDPDIDHLADHLRTARDRGAVLAGDPVLLASALVALLAVVADRDGDEVIETITTLFHSGAFAPGTAAP